MTERPATRDDLRQLAENALRLDSLDLAMRTSELLLREEAGDSEATWILDVIVRSHGGNRGPGLDGSGRLRERGME